MMFGLSGYLGDKNFKPTTNHFAGKSHSLNGTFVYLHFYTYSQSRIDSSESCAFAQSLALSESLRRIQQKNNNNNNNRSHSNNPQETMILVLIIQPTG